MTDEAVMTSYESVLALIEGAAKAGASGLRDISWASAARIVGISRDPVGQVEVFLRGARLVPSSEVVRDAIEFRAWHRHGASQFDANRLLFPALGHFDQVAAFVCTELLRGGADLDLGQAFARTEPIIELALERLRISHEAMLGLAGELLLLDAMCRRADANEVAQIVGSWNGWKTSARDFFRGSTGVEVKTTTRRTSSHLVQGVHQVEASDGSNGGVPEDRLYLVSIGLQPAEPGGNSFTIPQLVDRILGTMQTAGCGADGREFVFRISEYGSGEGYDHATMSEDSAYGVPFSTTFLRAYDMSDGAIEVLRRDGVAAHHHVDVSSVRFRVDLPVNASPGNPVTGANQAAQAILARAL